MGIGVSRGRTGQTAFQPAAEASDTNEHRPSSSRNSLWSRWFGGRGPTRTSAASLVGRAAHASKAPVAPQAVFDSLRIQVEGPFADGELADVSEALQKIPEGWRKGLDPLTIKRVAATSDASAVARHEQSVLDDGWLTDTIFLSNTWASVPDHRQFILLHEILHALLAAREREVQRADPTNAELDPKARREKAILHTPEPHPLVEAFAAAAPSGALTGREDPLDTEERLANAYAARWMRDSRYDRFLTPAKSFFETSAAKSALKL